MRCAGTTPRHVRTSARGWTDHALRHTMRHMVSNERITANLRKGLVEFCVLAILNGGSTYGLSLANRLQADGLIGNESTLYPLMARLLAAGLVESEWIPSDAGRPRKYYTLTAQGSEALISFRSSWATLRDAVDRTMEEVATR